MLLTTVLMSIHHPTHLLASPPRRYRHCLHGRQGRVTIIASVVVVVVTDVTADTAQ